jgi:hypothetical protein
MKYKFINQDLKYDGSQLRSLFAYLQYEIQGDSILSFIGPCDVTFEHMVDGEDLLAKAAIRGGKMLHFLIEEFGITLEMAVTRQRLFTSIVYEVLSKEVTGLHRHGDDIYYGDGKLSISIATVSPVSGLIHFAMNIINDETPVKTVCLNDLKIDAHQLSDKLSQAYIEELKTIKAACCKVRWVP